MWVCRVLECMEKRVSVLFDLRTARMRFPTAIYLLFGNSTQFKDSLAVNKTTSLFVSQHIPRAPNMSDGTQSHLRENSILQKNPQKEIDFKIIPCKCVTIVYS